MRELEYLQQHGTSMSMLFVTARNTSCGMVAGIDEGTFTLDYVKARWIDFLGPKRFRAFCEARALQTENHRWGKERVVRALIGTDVSKAADTIDGCFDAVYGGV